MEFCDDAELEELRQKVEWNGPPAGDRFLNIFMDQNNKCNLRCLMCGFSDARVPALQKYDLPRWVFDKIAREVFPLSSYVCLSLMTEPFMTRDFPERLHAVREYGVPYTDLITNGTHLTETAIGCILDARISRVSISMDGGTKATYEAIRPGASFEQVKRNFLRLQQKRNERGDTSTVLRINCILSELNIDAFDDFLLMLGELRPEEVFVLNVGRMSNAVIQENRSAEFWKEVRTNRVKLQSFCRSTGITDSGFLRDRDSVIELFTDAGDRITCRRPWNTLAIHANGDAYPCMAWSRPPIGNFARQTFDEIWGGETLACLKEEFENTQPRIDCHNCSVRRNANDPDDDFFFRKLANPPVSLSNN